MSRKPIRSDATQPPPDREAVYFTWRDAVEFLHSSQQEVTPREREQLLAQKTLQGIFRREGNKYYGGVAPTGRNKGQRGANAVMVPKEMALSIARAIVSRWRQAQAQVQAAEEEEQKKKKEKEKNKETEQDLRQEIAQLKAENDELKLEVVLLDLELQATEAAAMEALLDS